MSYQPWFEEDDPHTAPSSMLVTLTNGPCAGYVVEALSDHRTLMIPYGDKLELYQADHLGNWWHQPQATEDTA